MSEKSNIAVDDAYALESPDDNIALYREWAASYDSSFVEAERYVLHLRVAECLLARDPDSSGAVLDVGCGTGAVGLALCAGFGGVIDGIDISPEMLAVARRKTTGAGRPVYRRLIRADLTRAIDIPDNAYSALVSAGTFTHGHLGPDALDELWRVAAPGALAVIAVRSTHYESMGFQDRFAEDVASHTIAEPEQIAVRIYAEGTRNAAHGDDMARIVVCRVR